MKIYAASDMDIIQHYLDMLNYYTGHTSKSTGQYVCSGGTELSFQLPNSTATKYIASVNTKKDMIQLLIACNHAVDNMI